MADLCVIKPSPGKGLGVFASKPIKPGDIIMRDSMQMKLDRGKTDVTDQQVQKAFSAMSETDQAAFMQLHEGPVPYETQLLRIYKANSFSAPPHAFVYLKFSRINHCCTPNAEIAELDNEENALLVAVKPIAKGEEVFISYLGLLEEGSKVQRNQMTKANYGFDCDCAVCGLTGQEAAVSGGRRQLIAAMAHKRKGMEPATMELLRNVNGVMPGNQRMVLGRHQRRLRIPLTPGEKTAYGFLTAKLLEAEGYPGYQVCCAYVEAATSLLAQVHDLKTIIILPSAQYVIEWMEAAIAAMSKVRKPESKDLRDLKQFWSRLQQSEHLRTAKRYVCISTFLPPEEVLTVHLAR